MAQAVRAGARVINPPQATFYGGYPGYFADPHDHPWEVVCAPGLVVGADERLLTLDSPYGARARSLHSAAIAVAAGCLSSLSRGMISLAR